MSLSTTAAAFQNEMNASIAVEAINTRGTPDGATSDRDFMISSWKFGDSEQFHGFRNCSLSPNFASTHMTWCPSFLSLAASLFSLVRHQDLLIAINTSEPGLSDRRSPCSQSLA